MIVSHGYELTLTSKRIPKCKENIKVSVFIEPDTIAILYWFNSDPLLWVNSDPLLWDNNKPLLWSNSDPLWWVISDQLL